MIADLGAYSKIEVQWYAGERLLWHSHQTSASSNVENGYYDFPLDAGERLALGEYRVDVYVDGLLGQSLLFRIEGTTDQAPIMGLVAFAEGVDEGGQPVCPRIMFPPGSRAERRACMSMESIWSRLRTTLLAKVISGCLVPRSTRAEHCYASIT